MVDSVEAMVGSQSTGVVDVIMSNRLQASNGLVILIGGCDWEDGCGTQVRDG
jgi:hypothetical protein